MARKFKQKNIFETSFDSFEFDDGFLITLDSELKKNKINDKKSELLNKCKEDNKREKEEIKVLDKKANYDLPLFIEDLDEADFFGDSKNQTKQHSLKVVNSCEDEKQKKDLCKGFTSCLSPILGPKASKKLNISSSTPLKPNDDSLSKEKPSSSQKLEKNPTSNSEFDYLEADLFEDWGVDGIVKKEPPKDTVTFSQALKLIEEAEAARQSHEEGLNQSVDLLTGEIIGADMGKMFEESFDLPKSVEKSDKKPTNKIVNKLDEAKSKSKPAAAQKLNFGSEKLHSFNLTDDKEFSIGFNSDDDFDFLTQELLKKPKISSKYKKTGSKSPNLAKTRNNSQLKNSNLNDSTDDVIILKKNRRKCFNVIESDGTEDSPSPKFRKQNSTKKFGREFIDSEAEVSNEFEASSDEPVEDSEYDKSFVDEESYFSQNCAANMTAKYLESVKTVKRHGSFKIPAAKPYIPDHVFSQIPEESSTDYEIDSFCVPNDVEEETRTDLSDLEVAEKILEMDRRKKRKKRTQKLKKFK